MLTSSMLARRWVFCLIVATTCGLLLPRAAGGDEPEVDPQAKEVLDAFGKFYSKLSGFRMTTNIDLTVEQQGQKQSQEFVQHISGQRPNKLSYQLDSPLGGAAVISDGSELTVYAKPLDKYAVEKAPATWAAIFENPILAGTIGFGNAGGAMGAMLADDPAASLLERTQKVEYGGVVELDGRKCHLISATHEDFDWQIWIDAGQQPLLRQFVPNLQKAFAKLAEQSDQPSQFDGLKITNIVTYKDWEIDPTFAADAFAFHVPEGAAKVGSLMEMIGGGQQAEAKPHALLGQPAPPIDLELLDGGKLDLPSYKDKVVILDFWATWCGPCVRAMPIIEEVADKYKDQGVLLFAVNIEEDAEDIQAFLENAKLHVAVALDKDGAVARAYQADAIPQTVLIGKDGTVQVIKIGLSVDLAESLAQDLDALLVGKDLAAETLAAAKAKAGDTDPADAEEAPRAKENP